MNKRRQNRWYDVLVMILVLVTLGGTAIVDGLLAAAAVIVGAGACGWLLVRFFAWRQDLRTARGAH